MDFLRESYAKKLPAKISEIELAWLSLEKNWTLENLINLQRLAHNLRGASGTYGYSDLSLKAQEIESQMDCILLNTTTPDPQKPEKLELKKIHRLIEDLQLYNVAQPS